MKAFVLFLLLSTFATASAQEPATVAEVITTNDFSTLATALETAGLTETLEGDGPFTVFAPTDEAFEALPEGELDRLFANPEELKVVLTYHVSGEAFSSEEIAEFADDSTSPFSVVTLQGETLNLQPKENTGKPLYIDGTAQIVEADLQAGNGLVHVIDTVLLPQRPAGNMTGGEMTGGSPSGQ